MNENETNTISKMSIKVIGGGVYLKNKPQTITITWEIKDDNGNIITPDTLSVNNIPLDPTTTSKTYHRVFSDVDFTVRAVKDGVLAIGTTTARFVGPTQTVEDSLDSNSRSIAASANSVRLLNEKIENNNSFKGLFTSLDDLKKKLRSGNNGDWAIVGEGIPAPIYIWNKNGWEATGGQYTGSTIDLDSYYTKEGVADYTDDYNVSKNHSHIVKIYDTVNWQVVPRDPEAPVFQLGQSYDAGEVVNMTDDNDSSYECLQSTITAPYLSQEVRSFTLAEAISFLPEDLRVTGQKISFLSSELNAWMTYVFTGGDYTNPTYWEIFTNNIDPDTNQKIADLQAKDEDLQNQINEDVTNLNNHIAESDAKFEEIDNTLTEHEDRMDDIEDEILLSSVEAACAPKDVEILADRAYKDHLGNIIADEYITRDTLTEEIIDITNQQVTDLKPGSVQPEDLSEAVKQMIGCKNITNLPDEEDITVTEDNTLKFKDREYSPKDYSGMGKKILRKHYIDGVNVLTQHMINKPNTIYVIRYDYCLQGQTIEIPENCVLEFDGGSLRNGKVIGNNTKIISGILKIFDTNITLSGTWDLDCVYSEWFGAKADNNTDNISAFEKINSFKKPIQLLSGTYLISRTWNLKDYCFVKGVKQMDEGTRISPSSSFTDKILINIGDKDSEESLYNGYFGYINITNTSSSRTNIGIVTHRCSEEFEIEQLKIAGWDIGYYITSAWFILPRAISCYNCNYGMWASDKLPDDYQDIPVKNGDINNVSFRNCIFSNFYTSGVLLNGTNTAIIFDTCDFEQANSSIVAVHMPLNSATVIFLNCYWEVTCTAIKIDNTYNTGNISIIGGVLDCSPGKDNPCVILGKTYNAVIENLESKYWNSELKSDYTVTTEALTTTVIGTLTPGNKGSIKNLNTTGSNKIYFLSNNNNWSEVYGGCEATVWNVNTLGAISRNVNEKCDATFNFGFSSPTAVGNSSIYGMRIKHNYPTDTISVKKLINVDGEENETEAITISPRYVSVSGNEMFVIPVDDRTELKNKVSSTQTGSFGICSDTISGQNIYKLYLYNGTFRVVDTYPITAEHSGTTSERPNLDRNSEGFIYFDTDLNKPIWWTGSNWVDANGTTV